MRVAFVSANREQLPDAAIPLGLLYVMASTPERHERTLVDLCFEEEPTAVLAQRLLDFRPDVVALGMRNIQNAEYSGTSGTIGYYAELIEGIREVTSAPVVMGGSGFSVIPRELMQRLRPDYGISGEGEQAFARLLDALEAGDGFDGIGSLYRFDAGGELVSSPAPPGFLDPDALPVPDRRLVDDRYYERFGIESLQTKRGCPLRCDYCTYPIIEGRVGRRREPAAVADELCEVLATRPSTKHVFVVDSVFNLPLGHAKAVCRELALRGVSIPWTCYANPLGFDEELAELMARAGCAGMEVGADSGVDHVLERLRKGFTTEHIRRLHRIAAEAGLPDAQSFILGTPGESFDDVLRTLDFIVDLDPFTANLMVWVDDAEALDPALAAQRRQLRESILRLLDDHKRDFRWWSIPALGVNYDGKLFDLLRRRGFSGPLWQCIRGLVGGARSVS
ncbi:MAG: radical SAM protein [Myxococcota bacterium]|nr:radical SAM protein [Myxococcota bacterium]